MNIYPSQSLSIYFDIINSGIQKFPEYKYMSKLIKIIDSFLTYIYCSITLDNGTCMPCIIFLYGCIHVCVSDGLGERLHSDSDDDSAGGGWREAVREILAG